MKPFIFRIIQFTEHICEMHELAKYITPPSMKGKEYDEADWDVHDKELSENDICVATTDVLPTSMQD